MESKIEKPHSKSNPKNTTINLSTSISSEKKQKLDKIDVEFEKLLEELNIDKEEAEAIIEEYDSINFVGIVTTNHKKTTYMRTPKKSMASSLFRNLLLKN